MRLHEAAFRRTQLQMTASSCLPLQVDGRTAPSVNPGLESFAAAAPYLQLAALQTDGAGESWVNQVLQAAYRAAKAASFANHPDKGGTNEAFQAAHDAVQRLRDARWVHPSEMNDGRRRLSSHSKPDARAIRHLHSHLHLPPATCSSDMTDTQLRELQQILHGLDALGAGRPGRPTTATVAQPQQIKFECDIGGKIFRCTLQHLLTARMLVSVMVAREPLRRNKARERWRWTWRASRRCGALLCLQQTFPPCTICPTGGGVLLS